MSSLFNKVWVIFFIVLILSPNINASERQWLVGVWELHFDPDGDTKDWLEFTSDGKVYSLDSKHKRKVPGKYEMTRNEIDITFYWKGRAIPVLLTYETGRDALYAFSKKTGSTSMYMKVN